MEDNKEREMWTRITDEYKERPYMWDKKHKQYFNRDQRNQGFEAMFKIYKEYEKDANLKHFKKKLENMRTSFARELKKVYASTKKFGPDSDDVYKPSLWYFNLFAFLEETYEPLFCGGSDNIEYLDETAQYLELNDSSSHVNYQYGQYLVNAQDTSEDEVPPPKKQRMTLQKKKERLLDTAHQLFVTNTGDWEVMGRCIGLQLKDLDKHQLIIANKLISDIIYYAKLEKLRVESTITLKNPTSK